MDDSHPSHKSDVEATAARHAANMTTMGRTSRVPTMPTLRNMRRRAEKISMLWRTFYAWEPTPPEGLTHRSGQYRRLWRRGRGTAAPPRGRLKSSARSCSGAQYRAASGDNR